MSSFYFFWFVFFEGKILCHHFFVNLDKVFVIIFFLGSILEFVFTNEYLLKVKLSYMLKK